MDRTTSLYDIIFPNTDSVINLSESNSQNSTPISAAALAAIKPTDTPPAPPVSNKIFENLNSTPEKNLTTSIERGDYREALKLLDNYENHGDKHFLTILLHYYNDPSSYEKKLNDLLTKSKGQEKLLAITIFRVISTLITISYSPLFLRKHGQHLQLQQCMHEIFNKCDAFSIGPLLTQALLHCAYKLHIDATELSSDIIKFQDYPQFAIYALLLKIRFHSDTSDLIAELKNHPAAEVREYVGLYLRLKRLDKEQNGINILRSYCLYKLPIIPANSYIAIINRIYLEPQSSTLYETTLKQLIKACLQHPLNKELIYLRGFIKERLDLPDFINDYIACQELASLHSRIALNLATHYSTLNMELSCRYASLYEKHIENDLPSAETLLALSRLFLTLKKYDRAIFYTDLNISKFNLKTNICHLTELEIYNICVTYLIKASLMMKTPPPFENVSITNCLNIASRYANALPDSKKAEFESHYLLAQITLFIKMHEFERAHVLINDMKDVNAATDFLIDLYREEKNSAKLYELADNLINYELQCEALYAMQDWYRLSLTLIPLLLEERKEIDLPLLEMALETASHEEGFELKEILLNLSNSKLRKVLHNPYLHYLRAEALYKRRPDLAILELKKAPKNDFVTAALAAWMAEQSQIESPLSPAPAAAPLPLSAATPLLDKQALDKARIEKEQQSALRSAAAQKKKEDKKKLFDSNRLNSHAAPQPKVPLKPSVKVPLKSSDKPHAKAAASAKEVAKNTFSVNEPVPREIFAIVNNKNFDPKVAPKFLSTPLTPLEIGLSRMALNSLIELTTYTRRESVDEIKSLQMFHHAFNLAHALCFIPATKEQFLPWRHYLRHSPCISLSELLDFSRLIQEIKFETILKQLLDNKQKNFQMAPPSPISLGSHPQLVKRIHTSIETLNKHSSKFIEAGLMESYLNTAAFKDTLLGAYLNVGTCLRDLSQFHGFTFTENFMHQIIRQSNTLAHETGEAEMLIYAESDRLESTVVLGFFNIRHKILAQLDHAQKLLNAKPSRASAAAAAPNKFSQKKF